MKIIRMSTVSAVISLGMRSTFISPQEKMELHEHYVLVNDKVIVPLHRVVELVVEPESKPVAKVK